MAFQPTGHYSLSKIENTSFFRIFGAVFFTRLFYSSKIVICLCSFYKSDCLYFLRSLCESFASLQRLFLVISPRKKIQCVVFLKYQIPLKIFLESPPEFSENLTRRQTKNSPLAIKTIFNTIDEILSLKFERFPNSHKRFSVLTYHAIKFSDFFDSKFVKLALFCYTLEAIAFSKNTNILAFGRCFLVTFN